MDGPVGNLERINKLAFFGREPDISNTSISIDPPHSTDFVFELSTQSVANIALPTLTYTPDEGIFSVH